MRWTPAGKRKTKTAQSDMEKVREKGEGRVWMELESDSIMVITEILLAFVEEDQ